MRLAQIENGIVVNVIEVDAESIPDWAAGWPEAAGAGPGWHLIEGALVPPQASAQPVPLSVSRFQARAALMQAGLLSQVQEAIGNADDLTQLAWAEAVEFRRDSPAIAAIAVALGLSDAQIDALFIAAAEIRA